jgi:hypothetical protein
LRFEIGFGGVRELLRNSKHVFLQVLLNRLLINAAKTSEADESGIFRLHTLYCAAQQGLF